MISRALCAVRSCNISLVNLQRRTRAQRHPAHSFALHHATRTATTQAVQDLLAGDQGAAHAALRALGCRFALAPGVWARCRAGAHPGSAAAAPKTADPGAAPSTGGSLATAQPWLHDGVLPPVLAARLQAAFAPGAAYWREHAYADPGTPFFSYLFRLPGMTGGDSSGTGASDGGGDGGRPSTLLEAAAALCAQSAVDQASRGGGDASDGGGPAPLPPAALLQGATHVEFWAHTRPLDAPHQLHFDGGRSCVP